MPNKFDRLVTEVLASKLKKGDEIKNDNDECEHSGSEGKVVSVDKLPKKGCADVKNNNNMPGRLVKYKVTNDGKNYEKGDTLYKTADQLRKKTK